MHFSFTQYCSAVESSYVVGILLVTDEEIQSRKGQKSRSLERKCKKFSVHILVKIDLCLEVVSRSRQPLRYI